MTRKNSEDRISMYYIYIHNIVSSRNVQDHITNIRMTSKNYEDRISMHYIYIHNAVSHRNVQDHILPSN